jgi:hypothetical protein
VFNLCENCYNSRSPSARRHEAHTGFIAVLRYVDPCPGLPHRARRPLPAERRPKFISVTAWGAQFPGVFNLCENCYNSRSPSARQHEAHTGFIAVLRYVDPCPGLPHRARRPLPAERRPKFISVTLLVARFWECSTPSNWFNLFGNCYNSRSPSARQHEAHTGFIAVLRYVDPCPGLPHRARRPLPAERRPKFISVTLLVARFWECSTPSNWFNLFGNCYNSRSPSARRHEAHTGFIAVLRYVDPCPGLPHRARRPLPAERRPKFISVTLLVARFWECSTPSNWFNLFGNCYNSRSPSARRHEAHTGFIAVLRYVDPCPGLPHRARRPLPAERRPKFISVTLLVARFWECSTPSNWFNLFGNCYNSRSPSARRHEAHTGFIAVLRYVDPCPGLPHRARRPLPAERRPKFISVTLLVARFWECSTPSNWFNLFGNCYNSRSPSARRHEAHTGFIAVLRYVDPCPGLPHRARCPLAATGAAPSNRTCERCASALRAFAPPREPVRCTRRRGARGGITHKVSAFDGVCDPVQTEQSLRELL